MIENTGFNPSQLLSPVISRGRRIGRREYDGPLLSIDQLSGEYIGEGIVGEWMSMEDGCGVGNWGGSLPVEVLSSKSFPIICCCIRR
jgi:hypothetical protein